MTLYDERLVRPSRPELLESLERDLSIIRQDVVAVLQETASVRASMTEISSWRPAVSKRFIVMLGFLCFIVVAALVIYQTELQAWMRQIGQEHFMSRS